MMEFTVLIEKSDNGYAAYLPDLPGCVAAGDTIEETRDLIAEAVASHLELMTEDGEPIPEPNSIAQTLAINPVGSTYHTRFLEEPAGVTAD
ncbi:MAG: type II toxin-antitoxin system HicB family antitoxin [Dehalococcoidia bacterium]|nr:type II toxin-antitoxin system HicB family antitoxin [Dehalococcoidia bacterium]